MKAYYDYSMWNLTFKTLKVSEAFLEWGVLVYACITFFPDMVKCFELSLAEMVIHNDFFVTFN